MQTVTMYTRSTRELHNVSKDIQGMKKAKFIFNFIDPAKCARRGLHITIIRRANNSEINPRDIFRVWTLLWERCHLSVSAPPPLCPQNRAAVCSQHPYKSGPVAFSEHWHNLGRGASVQYVHFHHGVPVVAGVAFYVVVSARSHRCFFNTRQSFLYRS